MRSGLANVLFPRWRLSAKYQFEDVYKRQGLGCAVGDYNNDGRDDIYITALDGNHLFHNEGNGKFVDVTRKAGVRGSGFSTGAVWFDYDNDGKLDLLSLIHI